MFYFVTLQMEEDAGGCSAPPPEEGYLLVRIHVPELNVQKCLQFPRDQLVWDVKQQCLAALPKVKNGLVSCCVAQARSQAKFWLAAPHDQSSLTFTEEPLYSCFLTPPHLPYLGLHRHGLPSSSPLLVKMGRLQETATKKC
jgi:hypothetical protein